MRVSIYGRGQVGRRLAELLENVDEVDVLGPYGRDERESALGGGADVVAIATTSFLSEIAPDVRRALESGSNVVTSAEEAAFPWAVDDVLARELDALARRRGVSVLGTGLNPGFVFDALVLTAAGACARAQSIRVERVVDLSGFSAAVLRRIGIGHAPADFERGVASGAITGHIGFVQSMRVVADALGLVLEGVEREIAPIYAEREHAAAHLTVRLGASAGFDQRYVGVVDGEPWFEAAFAGHVDLQAIGRAPRDDIRIGGSTPLHLELEPGLDPRARPAAIIANSLRRLVDGPPGWLTVAQLPPAMPAARSAPRENAPERRAAPEAGRYRIGIDTGGTFTDLVLIDEQRGERRTVKVSSTPKRPSEAVFTALEAAAVPPEEVSLFVLGTTIATNALIERKGQRTLFVTTAGFEDVPFIQRINRRSLFDLQWSKPKPYVDRPDCLGVRERVAADGTIVEPLSDAEVQRVVEIARREHEREPGGVAIAICLLFSYLRPEHETMLAQALRSALPDAPVSVSSSVAPVWREYERANTVIVDAHLRRLLGGFARELGEGLRARRVAADCFLLKSNGGQAPAAAAAEQPANLILSGLAGGMIAAQHFAELAGRPNAITLDMGGTSADVGVVQEGRIRSASQYEFEFGLPIAVPVIDLSTIGAGGSSIAGFDQGGLLKVGPESAGADPGPAAYGKSGTQPTVTDANLVLGRLNPDFFLGGSIRLDARRAHAAVETVARRLASSIEDAAQAIVELAVENMAGAVRLLAADRGLDFRRFDLMAFGGAGPLHGSLLARRVGLAAVVTPPHPGLVSALGALAADLRVDRRVTKSLRSDLTGEEELRGALSALAAEALAELRREGEVEDPLLALSASCRYLGQSFEQDVPVSLDSDADLLAQIVRRFHEVHERAYGYRIEDATVEIVHLGAVAIQAGLPLPPVSLREGAEATPVGERRVHLEERGWSEVPIYRREQLGAQSVLHGPAIVEEMDTTILVLDRQRASVREGGILLIEEADGQQDGQQPHVPEAAREAIGG